MNPVSLSRVRPIAPPTNEQMGSIYKDIAKSALENGTAKSLLAPPVKDFNKFPHWNLHSDANLSKEVFLINGRVYVYEVFILMPPGKPDPSHPPALGVVRRNWFDCGPAPQICW